MTPLWEWSVSGAQAPSAPGAMERAHEDAGTVEAEYAGEALRELLERGPFWDVIDQGEEVTITVRPGVPDRPGSVPQAGAE